MGNEGQKAGKYEEPVLPEGHFQVRVSVYKLEIAGSGFLNSIVAGAAGAYHSGFVIDREEWSYGGHDQPGTSGVYPCEPELNPNYTFYQRLIMGTIKSSRSEIRQQIQSLAQSADWQGTAYELMERNCNHWTSEVCWKIMKTRPPDWINATANSFARNRRKKRRLEEALTSKHDEYVEQHGTSGEETFRSVFRNTFEKGFNRRWEERKSGAENCQIGTDPDEVKLRIEIQALEAAVICASQAADAAAAASRDAAAEREKQTEEGLAVWDQAWARESAELFREWQDAAVREELQDHAVRSQQTSMKLDVVRQAVVEYINKVQAEAEAQASGRDP